jgi:FAD/FMN-containing dehydrogenase
MTVPVPRIPGFTGTVMDAEHPEYHDARRVWNAMHDRHPRLIARCTSAEDVRAAIAYAVQEDLEIAVRGGGHSLPGHSSIEGGLLVDLSGLRAVRVDPDRRRVTVQGGALLGDVDTAVQEHGLVVPAGVISHTGVGGLTLGGGVGRLMRRFGLTIDSLVSAEVVTADGRILRADAATNSGLFWALRGGGGNFGVVTEFEFRAHELSELVVLSCFHPLDRAHEVLGTAQATMAAGPPDELLWTSFVRKAPSRPWLDPAFEGMPGVMSVIEWSGDPAEGRVLLTDLFHRLDPPTGSVDDVPYLFMQRAGDEEFGYGLYTYVKATFAAELRPELVDVLVERGRLLESPLTQVELLSMGGRIGAVASDATAFPYRDAAWLLNVPASWTDPAGTEYERRWVRETYAAIEAFATGGAYSNFIGDDEQDGGGDAYGVTLDRLRVVKRDYDPRNVFHRNQNVLPAVEQERV